MDSQETCMMKSSIKVDRISVLPENIIDYILIRLPILEAVRTSILSRSWRYRWHSLSEINLNSFNPRGSPVARVNIIDHILLVHCGSVNKFNLKTNLEACNDIDRWILYLSSNGIKELIINIRIGRRYTIPSCLFSCSDLMHLQLTNCTFKPPPAAFKAFCNVTELYFAEVEINDKELANLLNSCPLLSRLSLLSVNPRPSLKINAPNLLMFNIMEFRSYSRFNTPLLTSASFGLVSHVSSQITSNKDCKIVELLSSMPNLQVLKFLVHALQHFAVGDVPVRLPFVCQIKHLKMHINFDDLQETLAAFCIFRSSPIQILDITTWSDKHTSRISADGFWKGGHDFGFKFDHLQKVEVYGLDGSESELKFIEFLLANAPTLKTVEIYFGALDKDLLLTIVKKLTRCTRISPNAALELIY